MKDKLIETATEFYEWLQQNENVLPISANFWNIQSFKKVDYLNNSPQIILLKKHEAAMKQTTPFYKPYSKIVIL